MKYLAVKPMKGEALPTQAFNHAQNHFFFVKDGEPGSCLVTPYLIITDGNDVLLHVDRNDEIDVGFKFKVEQPGGVWTKSPEKFNEIVENAVRARFKKLFPQVLTRTGKAAEGDDLPVGKLEDLDPKLIHVHPTHCGGFSLTKRKFAPVYFVVVPNHCMVGLVMSEALSARVRAVNFRTFAQMAAKAPLTIMSRAIMRMIVTGEILFPIVSEPTDKNNPENTINEANE